MLPRMLRIARIYYVCCGKKEGEQKKKEREKGGRERERKRERKKEGKKGLTHPLQFVVVASSRVSS